MIITSKNQLTELLDLVHDYWFNVEHIALDKQENIVSIHLEKKKADLVAGSRNAISLIIKNAESLTIDDTEHVRDYDLDEIEYDSQIRCLVITGGIPIRVQIQVTSLRVEVP